jgi:hypothetical protein
MKQSQATCFSDSNRYNKKMAKITAIIPEPKEIYDPENQRQIMASLETLKNQLNFAFQKDLKDEQDTFNYFLS